MTVTTDKRGLNRLRSALRDDITYTARQQIADEIIDVMRANWSGYYPPASMPGSPPAVRTGTLDESLERRDNRAQRLVEIWGVYYWYFLEFGTSKMAPRPFVRPAVMESKRDLIEITKRELHYEIKRALS